MKSERIEKVQSLTPDAQANYSLNVAEAERKQRIGLIGQERLEPLEQVKDYLQRVNTTDPTLSRFVDELLQGKAWEKPPTLVACIPVVGTGNQEEDAITKTLTRLNEDPLVQSGDVGVLLYVNRPAGYAADKTAQIAISTLEKLGINGIVLESEIPLEIGNKEGPYRDDMAIQPNQAPIGLIRDLIAIAAMKLSLKDGNDNLPLLLQMDADFEGFMRGSMTDIIQQFTDENVRFLQCTSDWDSQEYPRDFDKELLLGTELMRELPQILKNALNNPFLSQQSRLQILFGEAIQRGLQVPQVERMEDIALKGGYGLNRLAHDELDENIRQSALTNPEGVRATGDVIFLWNNRRAVRTWFDYRQPAISQWVNSFAVIDPVRRAERSTNLNEKSYHTEAINRTLERFPIPKTLPGVYSDAKEAILKILSQYIPDINSLTILELPKGDELWYLQVEF